MTCIEHNIARLCDISKLMQKLFGSTYSPTRPETHPVVHKHETALYLLKEADYMQYVQMLMHWIGVDKSTSALLTFETLNITNEPAPTQPPPQPPTQQQQPPPTQQQPSSSNFAGLQCGFLTNNEPHPCNTNPNVPLVGVHLRDTTGEPVARSPSLTLRCADN